MILKTQRSRHRTLRVKMQVTVQNAQGLTLEQMRRFVAASDSLTLRARSRAQIYILIEEVLRRQRYQRLSKEDEEIVRPFPSTCSARPPPSTGGHRPPQSGSKARYRSSIQASLPAATPATIPGGQAGWRPANLAMSFLRPTVRKWTVSLVFSPSPSNFITVPTP